MKKFMLLTTVVGLALTSCVNDTEVAPSPNRPLVSFDSPVMRSTRAKYQGEIQGTTYPTSEDFTVFCKIHEGNYAGWNNPNSKDYFQADGDVANHDNSNSYWVTANTYYWPDAGYKLSFAAYSPANLANGAEVTRDATGFSIKNFSVSDNSDEHYDLMYTGTVANSVYSGQAVPLQFRHAMSSIVFSSSKENEDVKYEITDLKLSGKLYTEGNFSQKLVENASAEGYTETESPSWDFTDRSKAAVSYEPTFTAFDVPASAPMIFTENQSAILPIPQDIDESVVVSISYTKTVNDFTKTNHTANIRLIDFVDVNNGTTVTERWEVGKRYIYRIEFGQNKRIYFNPSVTPWETGGTYRYTIN